MTPPVQARRLDAGQRRRRWWRRRAAYEVAWWDETASRTQTRRTTDVPRDLHAWLGLDLTDGAVVREEADRLGGRWTDPHPPAPPGPGPADLARLAAELADLCDVSSHGWARRLRQASQQAAAAPTPEALSVVAASVLRMYGGTGSLNDLVLQDESGVLPGNDRLDEVRRSLHAAAVAAS